jgi:hypothetical protein
LTHVCKECSSMFRSTLSYFVKEGKMIFCSIL